MKKKFDSIRKKLLERKAELEELLASDYKDQQADNEVLDQGDQAVASTLEQIKISLHNNEKAEYDGIVKALGLMDKGLYGICIDCERPISEKRLELYPHALCCVSCQETREMQ